MTRRLALLALSAVTSACVPAAGVAVTDLQPTDLDALSADEVAADRVVVCMEDGADARQVVGSAGLRVLRDDAGCALVEAKGDVRATVGLLRDLPGVAQADPDVLYFPTRIDTPVVDPGLSLQWNLDAIHASAAWERGATGQDVVVAVVDTGFVYGGIDAPTLIDGYDAVDNDADPSDTTSGFSHGTHVAGTVAQRANTGVGYSGVAYDAVVMPIRVGDETGMPAYAIGAGIRYAVDNGADVINLSLGGDSRSPVIESAVAYAVEAGVIVVAASGNDAYDDKVSYPAAYDGVIAVGATNRRNHQASYSNGGAALDIVAPGGDCYLPTPTLQIVITDVDEDDAPECIVQESSNHRGFAGGVLRDERVAYDGPDSMGFVFAQGTSMSSPHVAGVAALLISAGADPADVPALLMDTARDLGDAGWDSVYGAGLVDAGAAVAAIGSVR